MAKQFTLQKKERIKSRKLIEELFSKGNSFICHPFRVVYIATAEGLQMGAGVSARNFKKAADRNRIKRLTKETYRLKKIPLQQHLQAQQKGLAVFFTFIQKEMPGFTTIAAGMDKALKKLIDQYHETNTAGS